MHPTTNHDHSRRSEKFAPRFRCFAWAMAGGGAVLTMIFLLGTALPGQSPTVEAETFIVKDKEGKIRAVLGLTDSSGKPGLVLYDHEGNANVLVHLGTDGSPGLAFYEKDRVRVALTVRDSQARLELFDRANRARLELGLSEDDAVSVKLRDQHGNLRAVLGDLELSPRFKSLKKRRSTASLVLFDKEEDAIWRAP